MQVDFNPARVAYYRLVGYENRLLAAEDSNNDRKDAGELDPAAAGGRSKVAAHGRRARGSQPRGSHCEPMYK